MTSATRPRIDAARYATAASATDMGSPTRWVWLGALTLAATVVRAVGLNGGLWVDEIYSLIESIRPPLSTILTRFPGDTHHPLYVPLAHLSITVLGEHPWTVRLPALLFGVASVPMLYALGALVASRREALLAAGLLAVSYHHVWFSQNARGYTMLGFWAMLSTYFLIRAVRERRRGLYAGYAVAAALGVYTHLTMVFMVAGQALAIAWLLVRRDPRDEQLRDWGTPFAAFVLAGVLSLLLYAPILAQVHDFFLYRPSRLQGASTPTWAFWEALRMLKVGFGGLGLLGTLVLAGGAFVVVGGVVSYLRQSRFVVLLFVLPGLVTFLGALAARGTMYPRFYFFLAGFAVLIVVRGAMIVGEWVANRLLKGRMNGTAAGTALVGAMVALSALSLPYGWRYPKQDFEGAMHFVETQRAPAEPIVTAGQATYAYREFYQRRWESVEGVDQLQTIRGRGAAVWVLYTLPRYLELRDPDLVALLRRECPVAGVFHGTLGGGDVTVCRLQPLARRNDSAVDDPAAAASSSPRPS